jgi:hypothetical protein
MGASSSMMSSRRPWTDSILGSLTPWNTKVADVVCDTCGKVVIADVKLGDLYDLPCDIEYARDRHLKHMIEIERTTVIRDKISSLKKTNSRIFVNLLLRNWHEYYTVKWTPIIEQKLKESGVF